MIRSFTALMMTATTALADPGMVERHLPLPYAPQSIEAALWYPAEAGGEPALYAKNPVFQGVAVREGAAAQAGKHPLILLSHGLGGNYRTLAWLAAGLAEDGAIVLAVNHPGSTTRDFDVDRGLNHWTRVADLRAATDDILADPEFGPLIDPDRISVVGFSYGGWTALSMAGLRGNLAGYAAHCAEVGARSTHCNDLAKAAVDWSRLDPAKWDASYRDPRISQVVAIDPGLTWGLSDADIAAEKAPALLIGLGHGADRLFATDTTPQGNNFAARLAGATVTEIAPASHFTVMLTCTDKGAAILAEEKDDPVCTDPVGTDREAVHGQIIAQIAAFLGLTTR